MKFSLYACETSSDCLYPYFLLCYHHVLHMYDIIFEQGVLLCFSVKVWDMEVFRSIHTYKGKEQITHPY